MKTFLLTGLLLSSTAALAQAPEPEEGGTAMFDLIARLAQEMDREFIVNPLYVRGIATTTAGADADFDSLRGILRSSNLVAVEIDDQIHIVPEQNMRSMPTRVLNEDDRRVSDHEIVTRVITLPDVPEDGSGPFATQLVPILRPMMPQNAQLGAPASGNKLILVDYYDNVRRMTAIVESMLSD